MPWARLHRMFALRGKAEHATRESVAKTPYFLEHLLSGPDNGRDGRFKAQSRLGWFGEKRDWPSESRGDLEETSQTAKQGSFWANLDKPRHVFDSSNARTGDLGYIVSVFSSIGLPRIEFSRLSRRFSLLIRPSRDPVPLLLVSLSFK